MDSPCEEWPGARDKDGYGIREVNGTTWRAHRYAYTQAFGPIPAGHVVRHRCDNPPCINAEHLELGTQADNLADMDERGRRNAPKGSDHYASTLTPADVRAIRTLRYASLTVLARRFHTTPAAIRDIRLGRTWKHVV
jgi:hypothetical protein